MEITLDLFIPHQEIDFREYNFLWSETFHITKYAFLDK